MADPVHDFPFLDYLPNFLAPCKSAAFSVGTLDTHVYDCFQGEHTEKVPTCCSYEIYADWLGWKGLHDFELKLYNSLSSKVREEMARGESPDVIMRVSYFSLHRLGPWTEASL